MSNVGQIKKGVELRELVGMAVVMFSGGSNWRSSSSTPIDLPTGQGVVSVKYLIRASSLPQIKEQHSG